MFGFKKAERAALDEAIRAVAKPASGIVVEEKVPEGHPFRPTESHFGGAPYFEAGESWPSLPDGTPYDFVCQVNLDDCPRRPEVPFQLFTVFYCWSLEEAADDESCVVRVYREPADGKAVAVPRPPARSKSDYKVRPCTVRFESFLTYPDWLAEIPSVRAAAEKVGHPEDVCLDALKRLGAWHDDRSRVGGYARWVHDNTLEDDEFFLLAQIGYEPKANNCIGDAAPIFIAVSRDDPPRIETDATQSH